jgi:hypothetical protein
MQQATEKNSGCLCIFVVFVFTIVSFAVVKFFIGLPDVVSIILATIASIAASNYLLGKPTWKSLLSNFIIIAILIGCLHFLGVFLLQFSSKSPSFMKEETVTASYIIEENDTILVHTSLRSWKDNYGNSYQGNLTVRIRDFIELRRYMETFNPTSRETFWREVYTKMDEMDAPKLDLVMALFKDIHNKKNLNQMEFAEMVVSCVQDIPYSFVFEETCLTPSSYEDAIKNILDDCPDCCIGDIRFGVQNPVSFIKNLKGDCDTRTVLIYSILKHFNYDVAIANSDFYRHSIIGLNIPATGLFKKHRGKKYTLWETTGKYFKLGYLPPNTDNVTHWNIILTSK